MASRLERQTSLTVGNLSRALRQVYHRWEEIGNSLGIPLSVIDNIRRNEYGHAGLCTEKLIDHWLHTDPGANWEKLAQALETLGENQVAADIRDQYISRNSIIKVFILYCKDDSIPGITADQWVESVLLLADFLTQCGQILCVFDLYEKNPPGNWDKWTLDHINESNFVIVVLSPQMAEGLKCTQHRILHMARGSFFCDSVYNVIQAPHFVPVFLNGCEPHSGNVREWIPPNLVMSSYFSLEHFADFVNGYKKGNDEEQESSLFHQYLETSLAQPRFSSITALVSHLRGQSWTPVNISQMTRRMPITAIPDALYSPMDSSLNPSNVILNPPVTSEVNPPVLSPVNLQKNQPVGTSAATEIDAAAGAALGVSTVGATTFATGLEKNGVTTSPQTRQMNLEEKTFFSDVTAALIKKLSISKKLANILLHGLPGSGKSSLLDRLLKRPPKEYYPSTGICEGNVLVEIGPSSTFISAYTGEGNTWNVTDFKESVVSQLEFITREGSSLGMTQTQPQTDISQLVSDTECHVQELLSKHNIKNITDLSKKGSIYIRDTGGQIEFQESLSLLIFGPSLFIFVIKTDVDIDAKNTIQYRSATGEIINKYKSSISTMDALVQFLTSVSAMQTTEEGVFQEAGTFVRQEPVVFIVGTHIDKLGSEAQSVLVHFNNTLHEMVRKRKFSPYIRYADHSVAKVMYEVDNTSKDDHGFQRLRSDINMYIQDRNEFSIEYPVNYLLFCLELQNIHDAVISMDTCKKLAAKFCIEDEDISSLLHFLHFRVGIVQHYNVEGISDIIIKEPQVLFHKITELIRKTFLSSSISSTQQERFCTNGILEASVFENLVNKKDQITPKQFLLFLIHHHVAVPFTDKSGVKQYFIPSVLNHVPKSPSDAVNTDVAPLAITFQLGHCPRGLFGMLISFLINPEGNQELTFDLLEDQIYQDQVSLLINSSEDVDQICLKSHVSHLEVSIDCETYSTSDIADIAPRSTTPNEVCNSVRLILHQCLQHSLKKLHYNCDKVGIGFSLKCPRHCGQLHEVQMGKNSCYMHCSTPKRRKLKMPESGGPWFNEGNGMSLSSSETDVDSATTSSESSAGIDAGQMLPIQHEGSSRGSSSTAAQCSSSNAADSQIPDFSLRNLTVLKYTDKEGQSQTVRLKDNISSKWREIGDLLELDMSRLDGISSQRQGDVRQCCRDVLIDWKKNGSPHYPASWEGFVNLLDDLELGSLAETLKSALNIS